MVNLNVAIKKQEFWIDICPEYFWGLPNNRSVMKICVSWKLCLNSTIQREKKEEKLLRLF